MEKSNESFGDGYPHRQVIQIGNTQAIVHNVQELVGLTECDDRVMIHGTFSKNAPVKSIEAVAAGTPWGVNTYAGYIELNSAVSDRANTEQLFCDLVENLAEDIDQEGEGIRYVVEPSKSTTASASYIVAALGTDDREFKVELRHEFGDTYITVENGINNQNVSGHTDQNEVDKENELYDFTELFVRILRDSRQLQTSFTPQDSSYLPKEFIFNASITELENISNIHTMKYQSYISKRRFSEVMRRAFTKPEDMHSTATNFQELVYELSGEEQKDLHSLTGISYSVKKQLLRLAEEYLYRDVLGNNYPTGIYLRCDDIEQISEVVDALAKTMRARPDYFSLGNFIRNKTAPKIHDYIEEFEKRGYFNEDNTLLHIGGLLQAHDDNPHHTTNLIFALDRLVEQNQNLVVVADIPELVSLPNSIIEKAEMFDNEVVIKKPCPELRQEIIAARLASMMVYDALQPLHEQIFRDADLDVKSLTDSLAGAMPSHIIDAIIQASDQKLQQIRNGKRAPITNHDIVRMYFDSF